MSDKICLICGNPVPANHKVFCSYKCFKIWSGKNRTISKICLVCGKKMIVKKSVYKKRKCDFCSMKCRSEYGRVEHKCEYCGKIFKTFRSYVRDGRKYCSKRCMGEHRKILYLGILNPHFKDGRAYIGKKMRRLSRYLKWRKDIFARDNYICQMCYKQFDKKYLEVHHIKRLWQLLRDYPKKDIDYNDEYFYEMDNGQTLCKKCHKKTYKEDNIE